MNWKGYLIEGINGALSGIGLALARDDQGFREVSRLREHRKQALTVRDPSAAGETAAVSALLAKFEIKDPGVAVDIAAGDGVNLSCTLPLYRDRGWSGLAVEADQKNFAMLCHAYQPFDRVQLGCLLVTPYNVVNLLRLYEVTEIDFLNIDIDSYDLEVTAALLDAGIRPKIISIEINEKIPPPIYFAVRYVDRDQKRGLRDSFYGCSAVAAVSKIKPRGYVLDSIEYNNAFFVRSDLSTRDTDVAEAYCRGYVERPNRRELFPWNDEFEDYLRISPIEALARIRTRFAFYDGLFDAHVS
jgi:hypothetical protein